MGAFVDRVARRFRMSEAELEFLERLEAKPVALSRGHVLVRAGDPAEQAFVLMTGWAMSYTRFPDGSHQVRRLHFPGDLLAMPSVPMRRHAEDIEGLSDCVVAPFPKRLLTRLFRLPRLAAVMYMLAQAERITAGDRLASMGRAPAKSRIAFLLLDIVHRLRSTDSSVTSSFRLHLTREQMAQVTGMTPVHASRMWSELVARRYIAVDGPFLTILDEPGLHDLAGYTERESDFDHAWLNAVDLAIEPPPLSQEHDVGSCYD
ncbi:MAG TPA: Crp/Fnr family transcriptional regulator [Allosphingosinicella sp.]|nr:Crp/Fnr family transcriptional regulator [Allosphingosinicella sp.]